MYPLVRRATATAAASPSLLIVCQAQNKRLSFQKTNLSNGGEEGNRPSEEEEGGQHGFLAARYIARSGLCLPACLAKAETSAIYVMQQSSCMYVCGGRSAFVHFHLQDMLIEIRYNKT